MKNQTDRIRYVLCLVMALFGLAIASGPVLGATWIYRLAIDPQNSSTVYAASWAGGASVFKSRDGGATWSRIFTVGSQDDAISALAIDPQNPSTVYAGNWTELNGGSVFKSRDGGTTWERTGFFGLRYVYEVSALAIDPKNPSTIYAGTDWRGVLKSTDGGSTWTGLAVQAYVTSLAIDPQTPSTIYAGAYGRATGPEGVFKSTDGGTTWSAVNSGLTSTIIVSSLAIDPQNPSTIYASSGVGTDEGVFKSTNSGTTWAKSGLTKLEVRALAIDPQNPSTVYAGTTRGVFKSTDGGTTWERTALSSDVPALALDPQNRNTIYAGSFGGVVFKTTDGGSTWSSISNGLADNTPILTLNSTNYCIEAFWRLQVSNAAPTAPIRLIGTSNGISWEITEWRRTDGNGSLSVGGRFAEGTEGNYTLSVEIGGVASNATSFAVSTCKP